MSVRAMGCLALLMASSISMAQDATRVEGSNVFQLAAARLHDAETIRTLSTEGQLLYQKDRIKLDGAMYCAQAIALAERGEFRLSIQAASKALILGQQQDNGNLVASAKRDLAIAYSYAGDLDRAEKYARDALAGASRITPVIAGPAYKTLGDVQARRGRLADAISSYQEARQVASARFRPLVDISLANAYVADGRLTEARALYDQMGLPDNLALQQAYQRGLGNLTLAEGKPQEAMKIFSQAAAQATGSDAAYHRLWAQEGRARSLLALDEKAQAREAYMQAARESESIRARFRSEEFKTGLFGDVQQIFDRAISLSMEAGEVQAAWRLSEASRSRALLDMVRERVSLAGPGNDAPFNAEPVGDDQVGAALRAGEAIVQYHSLDDRLLAWVLRPSGLQGYVLDPGRQALEQRVQAFRESVFQRRPQAQQLGRELHALLIEPLGLSSNERLLIVPHASLHYLPFQALRDADSYFIERHALATAPSASVAIQLVRRNHGGAGNLVAFGNPGTDARLALPGAEREVNQIGALFSDKKIFLQNDASKRQFLDNAGQAGILHLATHAEVDVIDPLQSRILLAPEAGDTGFLNAREVYDVDLKKVAMVTLSACESGLGRIARGDEILGFTRSFFTAGASALFVSLWPVADDSTELLMSTLYKELASGKQAIVAMQTAQVTVLRREKFAHPFFWAPFNLVGNWRLQIRS
ncbi:CHAT domain-containing protein [Polaromonas glacialis]|uniref:CHAT domain-containing protein n=1 Tax=Polaromonas glacialis TaxID=866564 RepID=UPI0006910E16|nr:CHAT domain-containing protein [Polaromonas glacialis]